MKYTTDGTTKRYMANSSCSYDSFALSSDDKYQFGCEFEFYIDTDFYDYDIAVDEIAKEIYKFTDVDILLDTVHNDGINFNFYKYMLLCDKAGLLSSWEPRVGYSQNVMDILSSNSKQISRKIKTKKGTIWNVEKIEPNHVEIKSIGGNDYHTKIEKITE